MSMLILSIWYR